MKATIHSPKLSIAFKLLPVVIMAFATVGVPRAWGDSCVPLSVSKVEVTPSTIFSGQTVQLTLKFTTNTDVVACNTNGALNWQIIWGGFLPGVTQPVIEGDCWVAWNTNTCQSQFYTSGFSPNGQSVRLTVIAGPAARGYLLTIGNGTPDNPANFGIFVGTACILGCSNPINMSDGNVWIPQTDYTVPGLGGGLTLSRHWNSRWQDATPPSVWGMFGFSWRSTYEEQLRAVNGQTLQYWRGDGSAWTFSYNAALNSYTLVSPPNERAQLVANPTGGFVLTFADHTQRIFNGDNYLSTIIDRNGNQTTIAYDVSDRITSVTGANGSTLTFTYGDPNNPLQATTVQDAVGTIATYTYDSLSRLTSVTYADGSGYNFTSDPNTSMILSVTDSQNKLIESHTYDSTGRGLTSARAYGVDSVSLTY